MIKLLPFILVPLLIVGILGYFRFSAGKSNPVTSLITQEKTEEAPVEVPKTVPGASTEDRVQSLEDTLTKLVPQVNVLKSGNSQSVTSVSDSKIAEIEAALTDLKVRIAALEKATPAPAAVSSTKYPLYIPLGSGGTIQSNSWTNLSTFQISLDPAQYSGYKSMQLEVNMRLNQPGGTLYAQLVNSSGSAISSTVSTTSTSSSIVTSSAFTLGSGSQTYTLQVKTSDGTQAFLDTARIKVNF